MDRKIYDTKLFLGIDFNDYWDLHNHPLYISIDRKQKPYFKLREIPISGYIKVASLDDITNFLGKNEWTFQKKYWKFISHSLIAALNIPHSNNY